MERYTVSGYEFTIREVELSESARPCTVEVAGLIENFDTRAEALLWIYTTARAAVAS